MELENNMQPGAPGTEPQGNGKMFTQEEVNQIVSDRLKKERAKSEPSEQDKRNSELDTKENNLNCREYLMSNSYPPELIEILDTSNSEKFIENVEKLRELLPDLGGKPKSGGMRHGSADIGDDPIAEAFRRK